MMLTRLERPESSSPQVSSMCPKRMNVRRNGRRCSSCSRVIQQIKVDSNVYDEHFQLPLLRSSVSTRRRTQAIADLQAVTCRLGGDKTVFACRVLCYLAAPTNGLTSGFVISRECHFGATSVTCLFGSNIGHHSKR